MSGYDVEQLKAWVVAEGLSVPATARLMLILRDRDAAREVEAGRQALRDAAEALEDRDKHHCFRPQGCVECGRQYERDNRVQWLRVRADGLGGTP